MAKPLVILGCGYIGSAIARAALAAGRQVRACRRSQGKLTALAELGAETKFVDVATPKQLPIVMSGLGGATVVYAVPSLQGMAPGQAIRSALQAAYGTGAECFIYLSSSGLYGAMPDDDVWIDEQTPVARDDSGMANILTDEAAIENCSYDRLRTVVLRLAPVYGPGRGLRERIIAGQFKILDDGQHATSRIHIDDVVTTVFAAEERAATKSTFLVADDQPTTQGEYARWLCDRLGLPLPPSRAMFEPGASRVSHRNRKIANTHMKDTLGITLAYPSFREGEAAIEAGANP